MLERVDIRVLGPLEIHRGGAPVPLRSTRVRGILALLLLRRGVVVPADVLIDAVWGDEPPPGARNTLQVHVSNLRKLLAGDPTIRLETRDPGYVLQIDAERVDLFRFQRLMDQGTTALGEGDAARAEALLGEALALWRGRPFEGVDVPGLPAAELMDLQERHDAALAMRLEAALALGRHLEVVQEAEGARAERPHDERLAALAALALYRSGRQADALEVCARLRRTLSEELGIEPGPAIGQLERQILEHDPALDLPELAAAGPEREARRLVTGFICRLAVGGSGGAADPEAQRVALAAAVEATREIVATHGGRVGEVIGARVAAVFGVSVVHEDDAVRAIRAAAEIRARVAGPGVETRIGVATGEVLVRESGDDRSLLSAGPLDEADQLARAARPGEVLLSPAAWRLSHLAVDAEPAKLILLPDDAPPISAYRLLEVAETGQPSRPRSSPLVGRHNDLATLTQALERAEREREASLVTVLGAAGVGKSRLVAEFVAGLDNRAVVLSGHCLPYGRDITLWPVAEVVRAAAQIPLGAPAEDATARITRFLDAHAAGEEDDIGFVTEQLLAVLGLAEVTTATEEITWALRRFLVGAAGDGALVVIVDDVHWAEATLLDLLEQLVASIHDAPVLVLCMARPDLLEQRPTWGAGRLGATTLTLGPLEDAESAELLDNLLGRAELDPATRARIMDAAEGHPLFLEELLSMLIEEEAIRWEEGRWVAAGDLREVPIPPTVQALLEARLDRLPPAEHAVLEKAAIVGRVFSETDLAALGAGDGAGPLLSALARRDLIVLERMGRQGRTFRFRHILIRDAVYRGIPKRARAEDHAAFGSLLEEQAGDRITEIDEVVGYHLEAAAVYRRELGVPDEGEPTLAQRAAERLASAGRRAFGRDDMPAAAGLLDRALALLDADDSRVPELSWRRVVALAEMGRFEDAVAELDRGEPAAERLGDVPWGARLRMERADIGFWRAPRAVDAHHLEQVATDAIAELEAVGDRSGLARACRLMAEALGTRGRFVEVMEWIAAGREHALAAGDERELREKQGSGGIHGPAPAEVCIEQLRAGVEHDRRPNPGSFAGLGLCFAMVDRPDEAAAAFERGLARARDLGVEWKAADVLMHQGAALLVLDDASAAEAALRPAVESLQRMGEQGMMSTAVAMLGEALYRQGRDDEAMLATIASESATAEDDVASQMAWRGVRAKILARRGDYREAERLARKGAAFADETDLLNMSGDAHLDLAVVLAATGRTEEATEELGRALGLYERKGNLVSARRARSVLADLAGSASIRT